MTKKLERKFNAIRNSRRKVAFDNLEKRLVELNSLPNGSEIVKNSSRKGERVTTKELEIARIKREIEILKSRIQ